MGNLISRPSSLPTISSSQTDNRSGIAVAGGISHAKPVAPMLMGSSLASNNEHATDISNQQINIDSPDEIQPQQQSSPSLHLPVVRETVNQLTCRVITDPSFLGKATTRAAKNKIDEGLELLVNLWNGCPPTHRCTTSEAAGLVWLVQAVGESKVGSFKSGAFNVSDPDGAILKYLDTCIEGYHRRSTHLKNMQKLTGQLQRGIDYKRAGGALPHKRGTILYGEIPKTRAGVQENRIYLKIERFGANFDPKKPINRINSELPQRRTTARDVREVINHLFFGLSGSLIRTATGHQQAHNAHREDMPNDVKEAFNRLKSVGIKSATGLTIEALETLAKNPSTATDIAAMSRLLNRVHAEIDNGLDPSDPAALMVHELRVLIDKFDNIDTRFGNEIVLNPNDFIEGIKNS